MGRPLLLIASRYESTAVAVQNFLDLFLPQGDISHRVEHFSYSASQQLFERIDKEGPEQLRDTIVLFDLAQEAGHAWNVKNVTAETGLAAQLVLSYPEIYFVFLGNAESLKDAVQDVHPYRKCPDWSVAERHHFVAVDRLAAIISLIGFHANGFRTIFDPTGVRSLLKKSLLSNTGNEDVAIYKGLSESRIRKVAVIPDEEAEFVYLNGYAAYMTGFRSWLATTEKEFWRLLLNKQKKESPRGATKGLDTLAAADLVLSDWYLVYPDQSSRIETRPILSEVYFPPEQGLVIVSSYKSKEQNDLLASQKGIWIPKPYSGFFHLLKHPPFGRRNPLRDRYQIAWRGIDQLGWASRWKLWLGNSVKTVIFYPWSFFGATKTTDCKNKEDNETNKTGAHTAPYGHTRIVNRLLSRARSIPTQQNTAPQNLIQKAILAGEAKEVLGGLSRTLAYESLSLQNEAECQAEISFYGTSSSVQVQDRFRKLEQEARVMQRAGPAKEGRDRKADQMSLLNVLVQTTNNLRRLLTEHEQMAAAEAAVRCFAKFQRRIARRTIPVHWLVPWILLVTVVGSALDWFFGISWGWAYLPIILATCVFSTIDYCQFGGAGGGFLYRIPSWYLDLATRDGTSVTSLVLASAIWIVFFSQIYAVLIANIPNYSERPRELQERALIHSAFSFVPLQPSSGMVHDALSGEKEWEGGNQEETDKIAADERLKGLRKLMADVWGATADYLTILAEEPGRFTSKWQSVVMQIGYTKWLFLELVIAYVHLGLLISVLYRRITQHAP